MSDFLGIPKFGKLRFTFGKVSSFSRFPNNLTVVIAGLAATIAEFERLICMVANEINQQQCISR